jgi:ribosomal protein L7/L12
MHIYKTDDELRAEFDGQLAMVRRMRAECDRFAMEIAQEADKSTMPVELKVAVVLAAGHKIYAIKIYREATGASLIDAKDFVENVAR